MSAEIKPQRWTVKRLKECTDHVLTQQQFRIESLEIRLHALERILGEILEPEQKEDDELLH